MSVSIDNYKKGNLSLYECSEGFIVMYKDETFYLELENIKCKIELTKNFNNKIISGTSLSAEQNDVLNDIFVFCSGRIEMMRYTLDNIVDEKDLETIVKFEKTLSTIKNNIPHNGVFNSSVILRIKLKCKNRTHKFNNVVHRQFSFELIPESIPVNNIFDINATKDKLCCVDMKSIDFSKFSLNIVNDKIYYNGKPQYFSLPKTKYVLFLDGKIDGNLIPIDNQETVSNLQNIKRILHIISKVKRGINTFIIDESTLKIGELSEYKDRNTFYASIIFSLHICDIMIEMRIHMLQVEKDDKEVFI